MSTVSALHRYVFDKANLEYIKGLGKNPNYQRPDWLNQKDLAEKTYSFNKILTHCRAIEGNDHLVQVLSPAAKSDNKRRTFTLQQKPVSPGPKNSESPSRSENFSSFSKTMSASPNLRSRKFN